MMFNEYLDPNYRFDMSKSRDLRFSNFVDHATKVLGALDSQLSEYFTLIMTQTLPLHCDGSELSEHESIRAIQLVHMHVTAKCELEEKRLCA